MSCRYETLTERATARSYINQYLPVFRHDLNNILNRSSFAMEINPVITYAICFAVFALIFQQAKGALKTSLEVSCAAPDYAGKRAWDFFNVLLLKDMLKAVRQGTLHILEHDLFEKLSIAKHGAIRTYQFSRLGAPTIATKDRDNVHAVLATQFSEFTTESRARKFAPLLSEHTMVCRACKYKRPPYLAYP